MPPEMLLLAQVAGLTVRFHLLIIAATLVLA
jgi:hypothetical protein